MNEQLTISIAHYQQRINAYLEQELDLLPQYEPTLLAAMRHGLLLGGKRIRPLLVYLIGELKHVSPNELDALAAALEAIHAYSLIHDDLPAMDDDDLRRGQPTCHVAFDEATAILAGDALQSFAFAQLAKADISDNAKVQAFSLLSHAAGYTGMCGGQAMDMKATNKQVDVDHLEQIHALKTGALITAAVELGAIASIIEPEYFPALHQYSQCIGLAFQVQDDILDVIGDTKELGKPQGSDIAANKSTYPSLLGLDGARAKAENLRLQALQALSTLPYNSQQLALLADYVVQRKN